MIKKIIRFSLVIKKKIKPNKKLFNKNKTNQNK